MTQLDDADYFETKSLKLHKYFFFREENEHINFILCYECITYIFFPLENTVIRTTQITISSPNSGLIRASFHPLSLTKVKDIRSGSKEGFYLTKPQKNRLWGVIREAFDRLSIHTIWEKDVSPIDK